MQLPTTLTSPVARAPQGTGEAQCGVRFVLLVAGLAICLWIAGRCRLAEGRSGAIHSQSAGGTNVTIDPRWVDGPGYRPVRVFIAPTAPTKADKTFTVEFLLRGRYFHGDGYDLRVARDIELPAGSGPVQATVSIPRYPDCEAYKVNALEDGELLLALLPSWAEFANLPTDWGECFPSILVVGDTRPNSSHMADLLPLEDYVGSQAARRFNRPPFPPANVSSFVNQALNAQKLPSLVSCGFSELPQRWIDYSSLDIVCLSLGQLEELAGKNPLALRAVLEWTAAGGNLWVYGMGQDWRGVGKLEDFLALPPGAADTSDPLKRGWRKPDDADYLRPVQGGLSEASEFERRTVWRSAGGLPPLPGRQPATETITPSDSAGTPRPVGKVPSGPHVLLREYEMGLVVAMASGKPFPGTADEWRGVLNAMGRDRWLWFRRHGVSTLRENTDYWNFLIPGVSLVPVIEFCVLITLFVAAIGPLNYWLLRRWGRLHLLVVTIPLGAATVTLALFAYVLVADGLGTRVRVRSVTRLDQSRGQAVCWARLSYYAGLAPRRGLRFPDDVAVLPLEHLPVPNRREGPLRREVIWDEGPGGEQQRWTSGWLNSRTPMQLLTVRSRRSGLGLIRSVDNSGRLRVKNGLGTRIRQLVVRTDEENYYWAEGIDADQTVALEQFTPQAAKRLRQAYHASRPRMPEDVQTRYYRSGRIFGLRPGRRPRGGNPALARPTQQTSRLEASLAEIPALAREKRRKQDSEATKEREPPAPPAGDLSPLEPGSYVAVVEKSPEVVPGVASAREEAGYHVILGKW